MNVQDAPHRRLGSQNTQEVQRGKEEGHANAGSSEQLAAATSESWSGELRAAKYGPKVLEHTARADAVRLTARAPPGAPALATHGLNIRCKKTNRAPQRTYLARGFTHIRAGSVFPWALRTRLC